MSHRVAAPAGICRRLGSNTAPGDGGKRYRQVFEHSSDALFILDVDPDGGLRLDSANPAAEEAFGLPASILKGLVFDRITEGRAGRSLGGALAEDMVHYRNCLATGMPTEYEGALELLPERRGGRRLFHVRLLPLVGDAGIERIIAIAHDVTLRKEYDHELRERARLEEQLSALAAAAPGFLFTLRSSPDGRTAFPFASPGVEDMFGLRPEDIRDDAEALHARFDPQDRAHMARLMENSDGRLAPLRVEVRVNHPAQGERWVEIRATPQPQPDGATEWHGLMIDVTARKDAEYERFRREREFRALTENSPDIIARFDRDCRRVYVNPAFEVACRMPVAEALGKTLEQTASMPRHAGRAYEAMLRKVIATGTPDKLEIGWERDGGEHVAYQVRAVPEFEEGGEVVSVLTVARDISALKETERRLLESRELLQALSARREEAREEERRRIARDLHEELGQLLTALRMRVSMLPLQFPDGGAALHEARNGMQALIDRTIQGMRDAVTALRPGALNAGLAVALEWLACEFSEHAGVECRLDLPTQGVDLDDLRATAVFRIVQEALTNVARHARARRVDIEFERQDERWHLRVRDDGCGFEASAVRAGSFGILGMSERAQILNGDFDIVGTPGGGTMVKVSFPAASQGSPTASCR